MYTEICQWLGIDYVYLNKFGPTCKSPAKPEKTWNEKNSDSLRSKRFRKVFRTFEAFFVF